MQTAADVRKVGLITLLAGVLIAIFLVYMSGYRVAGRTYTLDVFFDNARGLQRGDPVRLVGVKIGEVRSVSIPGPRKARVRVGLRRDVGLYSNYVFQIASGGIIQSRFVEVIPPAEAGEAGVRLAEGDEVQGVTAPDLADLLSAGHQMLANLNTVAGHFQSVLASEELMAGVKESLTNFAAAASASADLAAAAAVFAQQAGPETIGTLQEVHAAAVDLRSTTSALRVALADGTTLGDLAETARYVRETSANVDRLTQELAQMVSDPGTQEELRATISAAHATALSMYQVGLDLAVFSAQLREAAPAVPSMVQQAARVSEMAAQIQEGLKPPEIHGNFNVVHSPKADRTFSSGSLDFATRTGRFLRFGIDDIGEESTVNTQLGEKHRLGVLRYGLVRSRLGLGVDFRLPHNASLAVDLFDPNRVRADVTADVPLILGPTTWHVLAGVRDLGEGNLLIVGAGMRR